MVHDIDKIRAKVKKIDTINANVSNTIQRVTYETEEITVTPKTEKQVIKPTKGKFINKVTAEPVTADIDSDIQADNIKKGINILGIDGTYVGTDTTDATATVNDIISPATAYVNGEKIEGAIQGAYAAALPEQYNRQISYSVTMNDVDFEYNIGIYCSGTSLCRIYRLNDNSIDSAYVSVSTSNFSTSITFYSGKATLSHVPTVINGITYLRAYVVGKNSSNHVGVASFLINVETLECSCFVWGTVSSTSTNTPYLHNVPNTKNKCIIVYFNISSANAYTTYKLISFTETASSIKTIGSSGNNTSNTAEGLYDYQGQFSPDGKIFAGLSYMARMWGNPHYWTLIVRFSDDYNSFTILKNTVDNTKPLSNYSLLIDEKMYANGIYLYSLNNLSTVLGSLPFTPEKSCNGMTLGKYYFYLPNTSSTTLKIYEINNYTLTYVSSISVIANSVYYHQGKDINFVTTNNNLMGYKLGEQGALIGMKRLDVNFYNTYEAEGTNATHILKDKIAFNSEGKIIGTMANNGALNYTPSTSSQTIPQGYTSGGTIAAVTSSIDSNIAEGNIKSGVSILGVTGTYEGTGGSGEAVKGLFEGKTSELTNTIEGATIEEFGVTGVSEQDGIPTSNTPVDIQNVTGDIVVKVTNGTEEQAVTFPLGSQKLMEGSYLADDGIHNTRIQVAFNGTEDWQYYSGATSYFYIYMSSYNHKQNGVIISNCYKNVPNKTADYSIVLGASYFALIRDDRCTNVSSFKSFLSTQYANGTPVIVEYELAEEETITYTSAQQAAWNNLKQLTTYAGTTTVTTTNTVKPVLSGKYYIKAPELPVVVTNVNGTLQIKLDNKNLFNINGDVSTKYNGTTQTGNSVSNGVLKTTIDLNNFYGAGQKIYVGAGNTVTLSAKMCGVGKTPTSEESKCGNIAIHEENNKSREYTNAYYKNMNEVISVTFTPTTDYIYAAFCCNAPECTSLSFTDIQLEIGSVATEYETYVGINLINNQTATITMTESNKTTISLI